MDNRNVLTDDFEIAENFRTIFKKLSAQFRAQSTKQFTLLNIRKW